MALSPKARLGPYEIVSALGAGGMGEVYRARDGKLGRDVALKVLPDAFARDADRLARFEREARTLAALNHPHIAQIYGIEDSTDVRALVMEFVPGRTLDAMTAAPMRVRECLLIARQIADALEAAHESGIIHRDVKPANVKVRDDGTVKVLDFGLAKALEPGVPADGASPSNASTTLSPTTAQEGVLLGTASYMSPEQARRRPVDRRTDVWAFGVVLYEMLMGRRLFDGGSVSDTIAAVLRQDIDLTVLPPEAPPAVRRLIARCLDRDHRTRLRDMGEARVVLDEALSAPAAGVVSAAGPAPVAAASRAWLAWLLSAAAAIAVVTAGAAAWLRRAPPAAAAWDRFTQLTDQAGEEVAATLSPDGSSFAYASRARGSWDIYVQRVGGRNPQLVAGDGTREENAPAFSPDGRSIAFHETDEDGGIFLVGATGESVRRLTSFGFQPAWSPDGRRIAFCTEEVTTPYVRNQDSALWVADVGGGAPVKIYDGDAVQPTWSPDGGRIAFWASVEGQRDIKVVTDSGGPALAITDDLPLDWSPVWAPDGWLYFSSDRGGSMNLWRVRPLASGTAAPVEPVTLGVQAAISQPAFSHDGRRIVFRSTLQAVNPAAMPFDPVTEQLGEPKLLFRRTSILGPADISPDGQWLALSNLGERQEDVFICRIDGSELTRLTDDAGRDREPSWSPDGRQLAFYSNRTGTYQIWLVGRDGGGLRQLTAIRDAQYFPVYLPGTNRIISSSNRPGRPLYELDASTPPGARPPVEMSLQLAAGTSYGAVAISPDGKRLAGSLKNAAAVSTGITMFDLATRTLRTVGSDSTELVVGWLPDSKRVIGITTESQMVLYDADSGRRRALAVPSGFRLAADFLAISPDGRTIYVGILERESDIWMVERSLQGQ